MRSLRAQPVDILLWANGPIDRAVAKDLAYFHEHPFNVGQHVAHNEMLDECVKLGVDWHVRADDDCWMSTRTWLKRLLAAQDRVKELRGRFAVLGVRVDGLNEPPPSTQTFEIGRERIEIVDILGGIFRLSPMTLMRYFRWDERQAMGFGDATQFSRMCRSAGVDMFRVSSVRCTHGESTNKQKETDVAWDYEHDMLQYTPLGL